MLTVCQRLLVKRPTNLHNFSVTGQGRRYSPKFRRQLLPIKTAVTVTQNKSSKIE